MKEKLNIYLALFSRINFLLLTCCKASKDVFQALLHHSALRYKHCVFGLAQVEISKRHHLSSLLVGSYNPFETPRVCRIDVLIETWDMRQQGPVSGSHRVALR